VFHYSSGDSVDTAWQEAFHTWAVAQLGVTPPTITYNKYRDRAQMGALTGHGNTNGYADLPLNTLHTIWRTDNHEVVHVYAVPWGFPVALFVDVVVVAPPSIQLAVYLVPTCSGTPIHDLARAFRASGQLIPIASIAETSSFRARSDFVTYPESGSFVR